MSKEDCGCFVCTGKSTEFAGVCNACSKPVDVSSYLVGVKIGDYKSVEVIGRGFNGWMLKVEDDYQFFAMKIIPRHRLKTGMMADKEARALAACGGHRNIARFVRRLSDRVSVLGREIEVFCLVFEYIANARPLSRIFNDPTIALEKRDVAGILIGIASGLSRMHANLLWHDDLHDDNVLVRIVGTDENLNERYEAKLIDFGSTKPLLLGTPEPPRSDYYYLSKHIFCLIQAFEVVNQRQLTPADRSFSGRLRRLAHRLADENVSRREMRPTDVENEIKVALEECTTGQNFPSFKEMKEQMQVSFKEPLANTNALSMAPQDIALLFRDALGWSQRIEKSEPVFVVGPRGCGKTMFLRFLSIASYARPRETEDGVEAVAQRLRSMRHVGFLVNVGQLRTPFLRSGYKLLEKANPALAEDFCREYLNAQFVFEVVRTLIWLNSERLIVLAGDDLAAIAATVEELISIRKPSGGIAALETLAEELDRRVMELSSLSDSEVFNPTSLARDDVLVRVAKCVRSTSWCATKEVWFLLDDYSVTVLPQLAQRAYNPVLFRLSDELKIKISSEGDGPILTDTLGRKYREGRELTKVNLGEVYFGCAEDQGRQFFEQILEARFQATGTGNLATLRRLLGEHERSSDFGEYICSLKRPGDARFHGFGLLCRLCSGDVSFIIELLHSLTRGRWDENRVPLTPHEQDVIVKRFAQRQLADLRATSEHGNQLYDFAFHMGELIKSYLLKSKGKQADERLRIEVDGPGELSHQALKIQDALFRHSVLISGGAGKSKLGSPTRKLYFRRIFAPCFPFSPTRKGCIDVSFKDYEQWLLNPQRMLNSLKGSRKVAKPKGAKSKRDSKSQGKLNI
jgi:hypothetical protein